MDVTPEKISVVGVTALGVRALAFAYDGTALTPEGTSSQKLIWEQNLRDLELMAWPLATLQKAVAGSEWRIEEPRAGTRQVWRGNRLATEIHYAGASAWEGRSWLVNFEQRYSLDLDSKMVR